MDNGSRFIAQFFPLFLLGALFGKLMEDSGSVAAIAEFMTKQLGPQRAILTVVLAGALVTYGGVSLFVAFFVLVPMAQAVFRTAGIPNRLIPAAVALGTSTFTMSALPGTPAIQNAIPMPFFGTTPLAAPGLGIIASAIMLAFGLWWLGRAEAAARRKGEGFRLGLPRSGRRGGRRRDGAPARHYCARVDPPRSITAARAGEAPPIVLAALPLLVVVSVNVLMSLVILPQPRRFVPRRGAVWRDLALRSRRSVVGGDCAHGCDYHRHGRQLAAPARGCARQWIRAPTRRFCRF